MSLFNFLFFGGLLAVVLMLALPRLLLKLGLPKHCDCDDAPEYDLRRKCITCRRTISDEQSRNGTLIAI